ncbi:hypothetical protein EKO27_g9016 [Xylaria grammica]|uniref:Nudix hydrolase domain-containing protein n=1 Tax=Xylaria grammica TaxID=363999 RepID=A0A439CVA0_9PEZI|nr:hypothetical protein EKO27_g9016 [Xylaria grammica]
MQGEGHTPSSELTSVSLLVYRYNSVGMPEVLVRYKPSDQNPIYSTPYGDLRRGEMATDCARRIGGNSLGVDIPEDDLDLHNSTVATKDQVKIRIFTIEATPRYEEIVKLTNFRGWKYAFVALPFLHDDMFLHPDIKATKASLALFIQR